MKKEEGRGREEENNGSIYTLEGGVRVSQDHT